MHRLLARQLKRHNIASGAHGAEPDAWDALLETISRTYQEADDYRRLMERSLELSSAEMGELHAQLATERDMIGTVICSLSEGVCAVDAHGRILFINPGAIELLGLDNQSATEGKLLDELVCAHDPDGTSLPQIMNRCYESDRDWECRLIIADDTASFINCIITKLSAQSNGLVIALHDLTKQKQMEKERQELNHQLVNASRHAGMAEMATGVLHNVGNILNSINVAASVLEEGLRNSRYKNLKRAIGLIQTHETDLAHYLHEDEKGKQVAPYLAHLSDYLDELNRNLHEEAERLIENVSHAKHVVSSQQSMAKGRTLIEAVSIAEVIEDVLQMHAEPIQRHGIELVRNIEPLPRFTTDKHLVLQVLINIVNNAIKALKYSRQVEKRLIIQAAGTDEAGGAWARIEVIDNGVGIAPERLLEVFTFGHTRWENGDGTGFGLHSAANTAKLLGGELTASSDGAGHGARFTLRLPLNRGSEGMVA